MSTVSSVLVVCFIALAGLVHAGAGPVPPPTSPIQIRGHAAANCAGTARLQFFGYVNFTCSADDTIRYQCENGVLTDYDTCDFGCLNTSSQCANIGGNSPVCATAGAPPAIGLSCVYGLAASTGPITISTYIGSGTACARQSLVNVNIGLFLVDPANVYRWQCEGAGNVGFYICANASGGIGCAPYLDSASGAIAPQNCTVFAGTPTTGNATQFSCGNPFSNPNATNIQVVPVLAYKFYASGNCQNVLLLSMENQTGYCDTQTGNNLYGQCENRSGVITLATYACRSTCNTTNLAAAQCIDFTGTALGVVPGNCNPFNAQFGGRFTCTPPLIDPTASSFTSVSPTQPTASITPTVASSTPVVATSASSSSTVGATSRSSATATVASVGTQPTPTMASTGTMPTATRSSGTSTRASVMPTPTRGAGHLAVGLALIAGLLAALL